MKKVYIIAACRTPIGKMGGALADISAADLGSIVIKDAIRRSNLTVDQVDHVYMGCVIQAGLGQNVARQAALKAGLPVTTPAVTVNVVCGSGLDSVNLAAQMIQTGNADVVVAGGTENMDKAPFAMMKGRYGYRMGAPMGKSELIDTMVHDALWDSFNDCHMGITAEKICENWQLTRDELDMYAAGSQNKAVAATQAGEFVDEITPVIIRGPKGDVIVEKDEGPRAGTTIEGLAKLKPAFKKDGMVTAGNSSTINNGAAAVVLIGEDKMNELGIEPLAQWLGGALGGVDPAIMGIGPVVSTKKVLKKLNLSMDDIDLVEANEAFAAQAIAVARELDFDMDKVNVNGGAIALGHPVGASGCRILVTLLYAMKKRDAKMGLATLCIGGGMGCSTIVRRGEF